MANSVARTAVFPRLNRVFWLTLNGDLSDNDPMTMPKKDYAESPQVLEDGWIYDGQAVKGEHTRRFKLVSTPHPTEIGTRTLFDDVLKRLEKLKKLTKIGGIPGGQWRQAFLDKFPEGDGLGDIGVLDTSWVFLPNESWGRSFPCIYSCTSFFGCGFCPTNLGDYPAFPRFGDRGGWRWLVFAPKTRGGAKTRKKMRK